MPIGSFRIWIADKDGNALDVPRANDPDKDSRAPDPANTLAIDIYFGVDPNAPQPPPKEQGELQVETENVLNAVQRLYILNGNPTQKFRRYFMRLFRVAQLGLESASASPDVAKAALAGIVRDLINDEAGRVKNGHLVTLGKTVLLFSVPLIVGYVLLSLMPSESLAWLRRLSISRQTAAHFFLLWQGCFVGVWLSYGIRTTNITLADLTTTDSDRLHPHIRLLFASLLTMLLGMLFVLEIVEVKLGSLVVTKISENAMLALVVGILCGISESSLPSYAAKRATALFSDLK
jgi:hypothetical protein